MERRKDNTGKVLKEGESQRSDGRYQYRYTGIDKKRHTVYGKTLNELRQKEQEVQEMLKLRIEIASANMSVRSLVDKYIEVHQKSIKQTTFGQFETFRNRLKEDPFGDLKICDVNASTAKLWAKSLYESGLAYGTVNNYKAIMKPAFQMALEDNIIIRNPFNFSLSKIVQNCAEEKKPISAEEYARLIVFAKRDKRFMLLADIIIVLYETGLRVSELCGLTFSDIDLEKNIMKVERQVVSISGRGRVVQSLKTESSKRTIPISPAAKESILNLVIQRPKVKEEKEIGGFKDFLLITTCGNPMLGRDIQSHIRRMIAVYNYGHKENPLPDITPHTLRHTFCTRMILSGMNIKTVQYLMGHSSATVTLNIYSHIFSAADVVKEFESKIVETGRTPTQESILKGLSKDLLAVLTPQPEL